MVKICFLALLCSLFSCRTGEVLNTHILEQEQITLRNEAPRFAFEKFYKTSGISDFEFSPDETKVYFLKSDGKVKNVFQYQISSKTVSPVTEYNEPVNSYLVDPKGRYLFIQKDAGGSEVYDIYRFDLETKMSQQLTFGQNEENSNLGDISKTGERLFYSQSREKRSVYDIKVLFIRTGETAVIKKANNEMLICEGLHRGDDLLTFRRFINNNEQHLGVIDTRSTKSWYILAEKGVNTGPAYFNKDKFYFLSTKDSDKNRLWINQIGTNTNKLAPIGLENSLQSIAVSGKGGMSAVLYRGSLKPEARVYSGVFKNQKLLPVPLHKDLSGFKFSKENDSLGIFMVENSYTPTKYYLYAEGQIDLLYDSNQSGIPNSHFAKSFSMFVESFDGLKIPVHFFIPAGTSKTNKKPVILWIHGGPEDHVDPTYSSLFQYLVNRGYIVVAPNVRGSTGFGKAYQFMDNNDWGGGHIKDIRAVAEYSKTLDFVDNKNVFILGGSFGGFSVMSLITQYPKVFKGAVDIFGLVEMASFLDSWPPIAQQYWISEMGRDPRNDSKFNKELSPLYHVQNIEIPLQIHQGSNDIRVPKAQSDMLVKRMQALGKEVEYLVYPDEGHGFKKFSNSKKCHENIVAFFDKLEK